MMTREQLFKLGVGVRMVAHVLEQAGMKNHFAIAMTPTLICELKAADRELTLAYEKKPDGEQTFVGVPVVWLKTNGD